MTYLHHPDHDDIMLNAGALSIGYCRACGDWRVSCVGYGETVRGSGLAAYHEFIDHLSTTNPGSRQTIAFLRALGGHEPELDADCAAA